MNIYSFLVLTGAVLAPIIWQRGHFAAKPKAFLKTSLRDRLGLNLHHGHWGLVWMIVSIIWFAFGEKNIVVIGIAGFGMGLLLDEIIPSLKMPSIGRDKELEVYSNALKPTLILTIVIVLSFIILFVIFGK